MISTHPSPYLSNNHLLDASYVLSTTKPGEQRETRRQKDATWVFSRGMEAWEEGYLAAVGVGKTS